MTGSDLHYYLTELLDDLLNIGDVNLLSVAFRIILLVVGMVIIASIVKFIFRMFWDVFGGVFRWVGWLIATPYRVPKRWVRQIETKLQQRKWQKQQALQLENNRLLQEQQGREAESRRINEEKKALEILNQSPDFSKFKR